MLSERTLTKNHKPLTDEPPPMPPVQSGVDAAFICFRLAVQPKSETVVHGVEAEARRTSHPSFRLS